MLYLTATNKTRVIFEYNQDNQGKITPTLTSTTNKIPFDCNKENQGKITPSFTTTKKTRVK